MAGFSVAHAKDEDVAEAVFGVLEVIDGSGHPKFIAEGNPESEDLVLGGTSFRARSGGGNVERRPKRSSEARSGGRRSRVQGCDCGYTCS